MEVAEHNYLRFTLLYVSGDIKSILHLSLPPWIPAVISIAKGDSICLIFSRALHWTSLPLMRHCQVHQFHRFPFPPFFLTIPSNPPQPHPCFNAISSLQPQFSPCHLWLPSPSYHSSRCLSWIPFFVVFYFFTVFSYVVVCHHKRKTPMNITQWDGLHLSVIFHV